MNILIWFLRILLACLCGGAIGFERTRRLKEAGIRTHCIIAAAASLTMIVSKYGFADLAADGELLNGLRGADPARIAAQVISGISFLGAGVIFKNGNSVKGLTTAAGVWATAGVGIAIGCGLYLPGIFLTALVVVIQLMFHRFSIGNDAYSDFDVRIVADATEAFKKTILDAEEKKELQILSMKIERIEDGSDECTVVIRTRRQMTHRQLMEYFAKIPDVRSVSV